MNRIVRIIFLAIVPLFAIAAQEYTDDSLLHQGLRELKSGYNERAATLFRDVLGDDSSASLHSDALYWLTKTDIVLEEFDEARDAADRFLLFYPEDHRYEEIVYHRARLFHFISEPEQAIIALGAFIADYPGSQYVPSAYYWIGESLIVLGRLEAADAVFADLLDNYPASVKREAARFRRDEIMLLYRERELLALLKKNHEEYLQDAGELHRQETEPEVVIPPPQELKEAEPEPEEVIPPPQELKEAEAVAAELQLAYRELLLNMKDKLLLLSEYYVDELLRLQNER